MVTQAFRQNYSMYSTYMYSVFRFDVKYRSTLDVFDISYFDVRYSIFVFKSADL
jgi:hypothetical protein